MEISREMPREIPIEILREIPRDIPRDIPRETHPHNFSTILDHIMISAAIVALLDIVTIFVRLVELAKG